MERFSGGIIKETNSLSEGVIQSFDGVSIHILWEPSESSPLGRYESVSISDSERLSECVLWNLREGWVPGHALVLSECGDDCDCECNAKKEEADEEDSQKEGYLMPRGKNGERQWGPDPELKQKNSKKVLRSGVSEDTGVLKMLETAMALPHELQEKKHNPFKKSSVLGLGANKQRVHKKAGKYTCAKDPEDLGFSGAEAKKITRRLGAVEKYKQFCRKLRKEKDAAEVFTVNDDNRKSYMDDYNPRHKACMDKGRKAKKKPARMRPNDGTPNCGSVR